MSDDNDAIPSGVIVHRLGGACGNCGIRGSVKQVKETWDNVEELE